MNTSSFRCNQSCLFLLGYNSLSLGIKTNKCHMRIFSIIIMCSTSFPLYFPISSTCIHTFIHDIYAQTCIPLQVSVAFVVVYYEILYKCLTISSTQDLFYSIPQKIFGIFPKSKGTRGSHSHQLNYRYNLNCRNL